VRHALNKNDAEIQRGKMTMNNILIIDDNNSLLRSLAAIVGPQLKDCHVITAHNGKEGSAAIDSLPIAFILTDLNMPVVDGYGVIAHRNKTCPQVPLFVMSGDLFPEARVKLCELRVSGCIEKPFSFKQIMEIIEYELNVGSIDTVKNKRLRLQPAVHSLVCA
jgi:DNA-binding NtrC family response regulator